MGNEGPNTSVTKEAPDEELESVIVMIGYLDHSTYRAHGDVLQAQLGAVEVPVVGQIVFGKPWGRGIRCCRHVVPREVCNRGKAVCSRSTPKKENRPNNLPTPNEFKAGSHPIVVYTALVQGSGYTPEHVFPLKIWQVAMLCD